MKKLSQGLAWVAGAVLLVLVMARTFGSAGAPKLAPTTVSRIVQSIETPSAAVDHAPSTKVVAESTPSDSSLKPRAVVRAWTERKHYRSASEAMSALLPAAQSGDVKAMIGIALALRECQLEPPSLDEMKFAREQGARSGSPLDDDDEARINEYTSAFNRYCTLSHDEVFSQYRLWLLKAADSGDSEAQLLASVIPPIDDYYKDRMMQAAKRGDDSNVRLLDAEARKLSIKYAHMAMEQGEVWGVMQSRTLENSDEPNEKNPADFYLYNWLMSQIPQADGSFGHWDKQLEWAGKPLRSIDREIALERGRVILSKTKEWIWRPSPATLFESRDVALDR